MVVQLEKEVNIEDLRNHPAEVVETLRKLLAGGVQVHADPRRPDFYELENGSDVYYIHLSPATGKILLLATWKQEDPAGQARQDVQTA